MFARIPVNVIRASFQIVLVLDRVFPITRLPYPAFPIFRLGGRYMGLRQTSVEPFSGELFFNAFEYGLNSRNRRRAIE
jgi:hypothetical protein